MTAVSSSSRSTGSVSGSPDAKAPSTGPSGPHGTTWVPGLAAPLVASSTKSPQTNANFAPESVK